MDDPVKTLETAGCASGHEVLLWHQMLRGLFLLAGIAVFFYLLVSLGPSEIMALLARIGWNFILICAAYGAYLVIRARALLECIPDRTGIRYWDVLLIYVSGEAVKNLTFGGAFFSEPFKAVMIRKKGFPGDRAVAAALTEFLASLMVSGTLALAGLLLLLRYPLREPLKTATGVSAVGVAVFLLVSVLAGWFRVRPMSGFLRGIGALPWLPKRFRPNPDGARRVEDFLHLILRGRSARSLVLLFLELSAQTVLVFELYWILRASQLSHPLLFPFLIESAAKLIRVAFFFVPLQIGATEGVLSILFESLGLAASAGFTLSFVRRLRSLLVAGLGLLAGWWVTDRSS